MAPLLAPVIRTARRAAGSKQRRRREGPSKWMFACAAGVHTRCGGGPPSGAEASAQHTAAVLRAGQQRSGAPHGAAARQPGVAAGEDAAADPAPGRQNETFGLVLKF